MSKYISNIWKKIFSYEAPDTYDSTSRPSIKEYIQKRYTTQLKWYDEHATNSRILYYVLQFLIILFSALIPVINVFPSSTDSSFNIRIWSSVLGALIVILLGTLQITKSKENWISYRASAELMKSEYQQFVMQSGNYADEFVKDDAKRSNLFVSRMETIVSEEGKKFVDTRKNNDPSITIG